MILWASTKTPPPDPATLPNSIAREIHDKLRRQHKRMIRQPEYRPCPKCGCSVEYRYGMTRCPKCGVRKEHR